VPSRSGPSSRLNRRPRGPIPLTWAQNRLPRVPIRLAVARNRRPLRGPIPLTWAQNRLPRVPIRLVVAQNRRPLLGLIRLAAVPNRPPPAPSRLAAVQNRPPPAPSRLAAVLSRPLPGPIRLAVAPNRPPPAPSRLAAVLSRPLPVPIRLAVASNRPPRVPIRLAVVSKPHPVAPVWSNRAAAQPPVAPSLRRAARTRLAGARPREVPSRPPAVPSPRPAALIRSVAGRPLVALSPLLVVAPIRLVVAWHQVVPSLRPAALIRLVAGQPPVALSPLPAAPNRPPGVPIPLVAGLPLVALSPLLVAPIHLASAVRPQAASRRRPAVPSRPPAALIRSVAGRPLVATSPLPVAPTRLVSAVRPPAVLSPLPPAPIPLVEALNPPLAAASLRAAPIRSSRKAAGRATPSLELPAVEKKSTSGVGNPFADAVPSARFLFSGRKRPCYILVHHEPLHGSPTMTSLNPLVGVESTLSRVSGAIREFAQDLAAPVVGAFQICCSDETERETTDAFDRHFVRELLPPLKGDRRAAFLSVNVGARYEWGALGIAEEHFATAASRHAFKLLVVKLNSHVAVRNMPEGPAYGTLLRYGETSACCGALAAMFEQVQLPAIRELRELFAHGEAQRLEVLGDPGRVAPRYRALFSAITSAWLQARRVVLDVREFRPASPTMFVVLPCVTINRADDLDTELLVGQYGIDRTGSEIAAKYHGLGGDPARYRVRHEQGRVVVDETPA